LEQEEGIVFLESDGIEESGVRPERVEESIERERDDTMTKEGC